MFGWLNGKRRRKERVIVQAQACCQTIGDKWEAFNASLKFKEDVALSEIIATFAVPIEQGIRINYPQLVSKNGGTIMTLIMMSLAMRHPDDLETIMDACVRAAEINGMPIEPMDVLI
ncbi:hypothetical protein AncyloWKF20_05630 [Ancylobacter sp. WKF20]|uniref:hypothetical protein n=1 Tax=Ancylobacter sp. WKF20 TaxID=3039801 RepID=UPI0024340F73|nr:hypothetical protein [Ancylobacter sp. WKF20]WGD31306.1 hypothetical protein AncyloWKF20_05630 [Ancylobacter sp. WKF20]